MPLIQANEKLVKIRGRLITILILLLLVVGIPTVLLMREFRHEQASDALITAIKANDTASALTALKTGADPNARERTDDKPISVVEHIHQLWNKISHPNIKPGSDVRRTALLVCLDLPGEDNPGLVKALLDNGADPNLTGGMSVVSPTMWAAAGHHHQSLRLLLQYGGRLQQRDNNGETAFALAAANGNIADISMLLDAGADINMKDNYGDTPLSVVCRYGRGHYEAVPLLLQHHANPNLRDQEGYTPLDWALFREDESLIELLRKAGARTSDELDKSSIIR